VVTSPGDQNGRHLEKRRKCVIPEKDWANPPCLSSRVNAKRKNEANSGKAGAAKKSAVFNGSEKAIVARGGTFRCYPHTGGEKKKKKTELLRKRRPAVETLARKEGKRNRTPPQCGTKKMSLPTGGSRSFPTIAKDGAHSTVRHPKFNPKKEKVSLPAKAAAKIGGDPA